MNFREKYFPFHLQRPGHMRFPISCRLMRIYNVVLKINFIVIACGDPTFNMTVRFHKFESGTVSSSLQYNSSITISCQIGYFWNDGSQMKQIYCSASGSWTYSDSCIGIHLRKHYRLINVISLIN